MKRTVNPALEDAGQVGRATDQQLVELAGHGDHDAFSMLVEGRLHRAFRTASAILGNEADARDVVQEAFVSAWLKLPRLRDAQRFDAWLNRIVLNRCRDALRRRQRSREIALDGVLADTLDTASARSPELIGERLDMTLLNAAFERLPLHQRHLLVVHHLHHEPVANIARQLGVPVGTAKWRLHTARRALEKAMEAER